MKLKNKYSKQIIYSNQKFEDQIWYNQQIMTFLNFSQLPESVFRPNFPENTFLKTKPSFFFDWKVFSVDQLFGRQTNTGKFGKWFPGNHFPWNKQGLRSNWFWFFKKKWNWKKRDLMTNTSNMTTVPWVYN